MELQEVERKEFIPVKEKVKMIAQQQEEIFRREEEAKQDGRVRSRFQTHIREHPSQSEVLYN